MSIQKSEVGVCILFFGKLCQTIECITSLLSTGINIYVLNNGSSKDSNKALREFFKNEPTVKLLDSAENLGVSGGRNYLIRNTSEKWQLFVDNDIIMRTEDWATVFVRSVSRIIDAEVFVPRVYNIHEKKYHPLQALRIKDHKTAMESIDSNLSNFYFGGASFVNRNLFSRLGLYDEKMFVGFEDVEICIRAILGGEPVRSMIIPEIEMNHDHRPAGTEEDRRSVRIRYDHKLIRASYSRIIEKYGLIYEDPWDSWIEEQLKRMLGEPS